MPQLNDARSGCGTSCSACQLPHAVATCTAGGACAVGQCETGWADCDNDPSNGCEADLESAATCGACNVQCPAGKLCSSAGCVSGCTPPDTACTDRCVNLVMDPSHCGGCTNSGCPAAPGAFATCSGGTCGSVCQTGFVLCNGACVDVTSDPNNCSACGTKCTVPAGGVAVCSNGTCSGGCLAGYVACAGTCVIPTMDPLNCGACGNACGASQVCVAGACVAQSSLTLATGSQPEDITVDAQNVYWTDLGDNSVRAVPKAGGAVVTIATGQAKPRRMALDASYVYWANQLGGAIMRAPKDGTMAPAVVSTAVQPVAVAVVGSYVFFVEQTNGTSGDGDLQRAPAAGGSPVLWDTLGLPVPNQGPPWELVTDGDGTAVWTRTSGGLNNGRLYRADASSPSSMITVSTFDEAALPLAVDASYLYVAGGANHSGYGIAWYDRTTMMSLGGFALPYVGLQEAPAVGLAANACAIFWTGKTPTPPPFQSLVPSLEMYIYATGQIIPVLPLGKDGRMTSDGAYLYWIDGTAINRMPMP